MGKKTLLMIYKCTKNCPPDPALIINDVQVPRVYEVIHLGHKLSDGIYKFSYTKCVEDFNRQSNIFLANFKHANSNIRNVVFQNYCTSFYDSQILPLFGNCMEDIYTAWRIAMRRVWRVPWRTHNNMLPHLDGMIDPELWFAKRCIKIIVYVYEI